MTGAKLGKEFGQKTAFLDSLGVIINWCAHKYGYINFEVKNTSKNLLPIDILMLGEGYHNNHHKFSSRANFGYQWYEIDPIYPFLILFDKVGIIRLKQAAPVTHLGE